MRAVDSGNWKEVTKRNPRLHAATGAPHGSLSVSLSLSLSLYYNIPTGLSSASHQPIFVIVTASSLSPMPTALGQECPTALARSHPYPCLDPHRIVMTRAYQPQEPSPGNVDQNYMFLSFFIHKNRLICWWLTILRHSKLNISLPWWHPICRPGCKQNLGRHQDSFLAQTASTPKYQADNPILL